MKKTWVNWVWKRLLPPLPSERVINNNSSTRLLQAVVTQVDDDFWCQITLGTFRECFRHSTDISTNPQMETFTTAGKIITYSYIPLICRNKVDTWKWEKVRKRTMKETWNWIRTWPGKIVVFVATSNPTYPVSSFCLVIKRGKWKLDHPTLNSYVTRKNYVFCCLEMLELFKYLAFISSGPSFCQSWYFPKFAVISII